MPIGSMDIVDNFPYQDLRDYYQKWYRPDLQAIVVVGDIDVDKMEKKIKKTFSSIPMPKKPAERIYYPVNDNEKMIVAIEKDAEQPIVLCHLYQKRDATPDNEKNNAAYLRGDYIDNLISTMLNDRYAEFNRSLMQKMRAYTYYQTHHGDSSVYLDVIQALADTNAFQRKKVISQARIQAFNEQNDVQTYNSIIDSDREYINRHWIELMRKFTLSVACLLLFLIGAPFGSIVRKGGLGMPLVASVIFFVLYYVIGMISEKSVRESAVGPVGMWVSTFVFIPIGALLTWQATTDSSLFDLATWKRWLRIKNRHKHKPDSQ
jgi:hypothetical protein